MKNSKKIIAGLMLSVAFLSVAAPVVANADVLTSDNSVQQPAADVNVASDSNGADAILSDSNVTGEISVSNADILNYIKVNDPAGYSQISESTKATLLRADLLRAGTTKITFSAGGFKIYLNSSTANWCKTAGGIAIAGLFGAIGTAAGSPIAGGLCAAAGAALGVAIGNWNVSKGIWVSYNWLGFMTGHGSQ